MTDYILITVYLLSVISIFIVPLFINVKQGRVVALSLLPVLLVAIVSSLIMLFSYFWSEVSITEVLTFSIFLFFEFIFFGYLMMFPIVVLVAFVVEYLREYYHVSLRILSLIGGSLGAIIVGITFMKWEFVLAAFISGAVAVLVQYYFTEYNQEKTKSL